MYNEINIYCDESCHLEHDKSKIMIVLEDRKKSYILITAYYITYAHEFQKKLKEYELYKNNTL